MMMFKRLFAALSVAAVAACGGGGGNSGTSPLGPNSAASAPAVIAAADLIVETSANQLPNTSTGSVTITATAVNAARVVVSGATVSLSADNDGVIAQSASTTDASGKVSGTLTIGGNRANRPITVTVTSGSVTKTVLVQVTGARITSTLVPAVVAPSTAGQVQYRVVDQAGNPMVGQAVSITAPGMSPASATGTTGANGEFTFSYTSSATSGAYPIAATIAGVTDTQSVTVQAAANVDPVPVATTIASASVSANPSVVGINAVGASSNRSEIRALFLTAGNVPVKNVRVRFDLAGDANSIGGSFSTGSNTLFSDANGVVSTAYLPGSRSSPTDGVTVRACYGKTDSDPALLNCTSNAIVKLTVVSEPLGVSIGTNEQIIVSELSYTKRFLVSVADSAGNAKGDVALSVSLDLKQYRKGRYDLAGDSWIKTTGPAPGDDTAVCLNEDSNRNGVLESGEDLNNNQRLDPGRSDVTVRLLSPRTAADGTAVVEISYAKSFGSWVDAWVTVAASGVSGTEGRATYVLDPIPVDAASIKNKDVEPAYRFSPYGTASSCASPN